MIFLLPATKPRDAKEYFHPAILLVDSSVLTDENEIGRFREWGVNFFYSRTIQRQSWEIKMNHCSVYEDENL